MGCSSVTLVSCDHLILIILNTNHPFAFVQEAVFKMHVKQLSVRLTCHVMKEDIQD